MSSHRAVNSEVLLEEDARNRALRTLLVNLVVDTGVACLLVLVAAFGKAETWGDFEWNLLGFTLCKTAVVSAGSYILRRFIDPSQIPTPLPPKPQAEPADAVMPVDPDDERYS